MAILERYTFGVGDRFAQQASAQLKAFEMLKERGITVIPVWNKSNREHSFVGSEPQSVYDAAAAAVKQAGWQEGWHVDADHIRLETVDRFIPCSNFFTIDVADSIGQPAPAADVEAFVTKHTELAHPLHVEGIVEPLVLSPARLRSVVEKYLLAVQEAGRIYRHVVEKKGGTEQVIAEVSMDETDTPQTPPELLIILAMLADEKVPLQTIAPKFTGRFNKGVDYVGDLKQFEREFLDDLAILKHASIYYGLPKNLKLSVHSGSDKFSLYPIIHKALKATGAGLHLKTAGTTWLEELIGLSEAGGEGLTLAKEIYSYAEQHIEELTAPYASVIDISWSRIPANSVINTWTGAQLASALRHVPGNPEFNPHMRQLLHVSFKVAAQQGERYLSLLRSNAEIVGRNVTQNIYERHLLPLFVGDVAHHS